MPNGRRHDAFRPAAPAPKTRSALRVVRTTHQTRSTQQPRAVREGRVGVDLRARAPQAGMLSAPAPTRGPRTKRAAVSPARAGVPVASGLPAARSVRSAPGGRGGGRRRSAMRRIALVALVAAYLTCIGLLVWALTSPTWQVRRVVVVGTDDATLVSAIEALPLRGCNIFRCDIDRQTRLVEALPLVASAQVYADYPDGLVVNVTPRQPALLWHVGSTAVVVASDGTVLGAPDSDPAFTTATLTDVRDDGAAALGGRLPAPGEQIGTPLANMASQLRTGLLSVLDQGWSLRYTADEGFVAVEASGTQVVFGTPDDAAQAGAPGAERGIAAQLDELRQVLTLLSGNSQRASVIDLRWGAHPDYRLATG